MDNSAEICKPIPCWTGTMENSLVWIIFNMSLVLETYFKPEFFFLLLLNVNFFVFICCCNGGVS